MLFRSVVVETVRGIELGEMISDLRPFSTYSSNLALKPITRKATRHDIESDARNKRDTVEATKQCQKCIDELGLEMYLISTEYTLDRSKIIFSWGRYERYVLYSFFTKEPSGTSGTSRVPDWAWNCSRSVTISPSVTWCVTGQ